MSSVQQRGIFRGATAIFSTQFYDKYGDVTQPTAAQVVLKYPNATGGLDQAIVAMTAPTLPDTKWSAEWDSRGAYPGTAFYSIETLNAAIPVSVEDGDFTIRANVANQLTF